VLAVTALLASVAVAPAGAAPSQAGDWTDPAEANRVDHVKPGIDWFDCSPLVLEGSADCGTATVPVDYDKPSGAKTELAVLRLRARKPKQRIGSLFVNPGGPGGSGVSLAAYSAAFLSADLLDRFDIVGFDPRGTNLSDNVRCWKNLGEQAKALAGLAPAFPFANAQLGPYVQSAKAFGTACSSAVGRPLNAALSTAETARDMDVLRHALGDSQLTYLGFSYGSYLGTVYANMFPDRVRAVAIDGVLDPVGWAGTPGTSSVPQTARIKSGEGAAQAMAALLTRCGEKGRTTCAFASVGTGDPVRSYASIIAGLKAAPVQFDGWALDYPTLMSFLLGDLYDPYAGVMVDSDLTWIWTLLHGDPTAAAQAAQALALRRSVTSAAAERSAAFRDKVKHLSAGAGFAVQWPYDNSLETFQTVLCSDGLNPADAGYWAGYSSFAESAAPGFGPLWTWASAPCATNTWTVRDPAAYRGPFTRRTANPVLVVGYQHDPATNYAGAVSVSNLLPNSRLLSNDNWGHTAWGTSDCDTAATTAYLVSLTLPAKGTLCHSDIQPFTDPIAAEQRAAVQRPLRTAPVDALAPMGVTPRS
jgi:pimeloyl-ACP methyl ester carboxylesterase